MTLPVGLEAQFAMADEATYGTYVAPTRFLEFVNESLELTVERIESSAIRRGNTVMRTDRQYPNRKGAGGDVSFEVCSSGFGLLFKHALGSVATSASGAGKRHRFTLGDLSNLSFSSQVLKPDAASGVNPFSYVGCKIPKWELSEGVDGLLMFAPAIDARDEDTTQSLVTGTPASGATVELFTFVNSTLTLAGSQYDCGNLSLQCDNGLKTDRYFIGGSSLKRAPLTEDLRALTVSCDSEFRGMTAYNRLASGAPAAIVATFQGTQNYDTGLVNKVVVTLPACRTDSETPKVADKGVVEQPLAFTALYDGTNEPITLDYFTGDATP